MGEYQSFNPEELSQVEVPVEYEPGTGIHFSTIDKTRRLEFPHGEAAVKLYLEQHEDNPERAEKISEIFHEFFELELQNTKIFSSELYPGVSFPYTSINIADLAKRIFLKYNTEIPEQHDSEQQSIDLPKAEFIFGSYLTPDNGLILTFVEEAMQQAIKRLPKAFKDLSEGRPIAIHEIHTVGSPTNSIGSMTPAYEAALSEDAFGTIGKLYAEYIEKQVSM